jgi:hypothetical protein
VALKLLREGSGERADRLIAEARAMARVAHPNVVAIHDVGTLEEKLFFTMELVEGAPLGEVAARYVLPLARAALRDTRALRDALTRRRPAAPSVASSRS